MAIQLNVNAPMESNLKGVIALPGFGFRWEKSCQISPLIRVK